MTVIRHAPKIHLQTLAPNRRKVWLVNNSISIILPHIITSEKKLFYQLAFRYFCKENVAIFSTLSSFGSGSPVLGSVKGGALIDIRLTIFSASSGEGEVMTSLDVVSLLIIVLDGDQR